MKCVFENQNLQKISSQIERILVIFTHLKLWVAVARHNFKWVKIVIINVALQGLTLCV